MQQHSKLKTQKGADILCKMHISTEKDQVLITEALYHAEMWQ